MGTCRSSGGNFVLRSFHQFGFLFVFSKAVIGIGRRDIFADRRFTHGCIHQLEQPLATVVEEGVEIIGLNRTGFVGGFNS
jgi:hypothetical protein